MTTNKVRFTPGQIVATPLALEALGRAYQGDEKNGAAQYLVRHLRGDWGDLDTEDTAQNNRHAKAGEGMLMSAYALPDGTKIWIITEADRSATTILLPEEY